MLRLQSAVSSPSWAAHVDHLLDSFSQHYAFDQDKVSLRTSVQSYLFRGYAVRYVMMHCREAENARASKALQPILLVFLEDDHEVPPLSSWLRSLSSYNFCDQSLRIIRTNHGPNIKGKNYLAYRSFFLACICGFQEIVVYRLQSAIPIRVVLWGLLLSTRA